MSLKTKKDFPLVTLLDGTEKSITINDDSFRINYAINCSEPDVSPDDKFFFMFRLSDTNLYYSSTYTDVNILGVIDIKKIDDVKKEEKIREDNTTFKGEDDEADNLKSKFYCFKTIDSKFKEWTVCAKEMKTRQKWVCKIKHHLKLAVPDECKNLKYTPIVKVETHDIIQPEVIIPLPSPHCNEHWDYRKKGEDWNCECEDGTEQSPIDLPTIKKSIDSPVKPLFQYKEVEPKYNMDTIDEVMKKEGRNDVDTIMNIRLIDGHLSLFHYNLGKIITLDGAVYRAEEITFHTPSNHRIDGKQYPLEISIIHYGISKGDIANQIILNFVFEKAPGINNKFIDDIDFFNLPNSVTKQRIIDRKLFIPKILYELTPDNKHNMVIMKPFSFYTYQGSIAFPPCTERTINYVNSKPLRIGNLALQLFKETLRIPDMINNKGDVIVSDWLPESSRNLKERNGRPVFHYDHTKYCDPEIPEPKVKS